MGRWAAVFQLPTSTSPEIAPDQFAAGVTGIVLKQSGPWTYGALVNHLWDVGGGSTDINASFVRPFLSYTTPTAWTFSVNSESTYDWNAKQWTAPINVTVAKLININGQPISIGGGVRHWLDAPDAGPMAALRGCL